MSPNEEYYLFDEDRSVAFDSYLSFLLLLGANQGSGLQPTFNGSRLLGHLVGGPKESFDGKANVRRSSGRYQDGRDWRGFIRDQVLC